jgi:hypothetical protein
MQATRIAAPAPINALRILVFSSGTG